MKIRFAAIAAVWVGVALAQAPEPPPPGGPPGGPPGVRHETPAEHLDHLAILLDLTAAQKPQVQAVLEEQHAQMQAQRDQARAAGTRPTFEEMKAAREQAQQQTLAKLTPILTAAQLAKYQVLMSERRPPGPMH